MACSVKIFFHYENLRVSLWKNSKDLCMIFLMIHKIADDKVRESTGGALSFFPKLFLYRRPRVFRQPKHPKTPRSNLYDSWHNGRTQEVVLDVIHTLRFFDDFHPVSWFKFVFCIVVPASFHGQNTPEHPNNTPFSPRTLDRRIRGLSIFSKILVFFSIFPPFFWIVFCIFFNLFFHAQNTPKRPGNTPLQYEIG